jgi:hypothetical protein
MTEDTNMEFIWGMVFATFVYVISFVVSVRYP